MQKQSLLISVDENAEKNQVIASFCINLVQSYIVSS
jgi:hypothetical protein